MYYEILDFMVKSIKFNKIHFETELESNQNIIDNNSEILDRIEDEIKLIVDEKNRRLDLLKENLQKEQFTVTQSELDRYLFENLTSLNPVLDSKNILTIYFGDKWLELKKTGEKSSKIHIYQSGSITYLLKYAVTEKDMNERSTIIKMRDQERVNNNKCAIISARIVNNGSKFITLIPQMDGNLFKFDVESLSLQDKKVILDSVRSQMECILKLNDDNVIEEKEQNHFKFAYVNISPKNVLFQLKENSPEELVNSYEFKLGNIGSISESKITFGFTSTYYVQLENILFINNRIPNKKIVKSMRYVFGLFSYLLVNNMLSGYVPKLHTISELMSFNNNLRLAYGQEYNNLIIDNYHTKRVSMYN